MENIKKRTYRRRSKKHSVHIKISASSAHKDVIEPFITVWVRWKSLAALAIPVPHWRLGISWDHLKAARQHQDVTRRAQRTMPCLKSQLCIAQRKHKRKVARDTGEHLRLAPYQTGRLEDLIVSGLKA